MEILSLPRIENTMLWSRHKVCCCCCWSFKEIVRSYFETRLTARVSQFWHDTFGGPLQHYSSIAPAVLCPVFSFLLSVEVGFSEFCTQKKSCIIWRIEVKIEEPYRVGLWVCALVSRKYNRNPISLALEFDTRQWAWYLDSVPRSPHNITVSSHSHISHDDPAQISGQVGHQQSAVCVSWP